MPVRIPSFVSCSLLAGVLASAGGCATPAPNGGAASAGWAADDQVFAMRAAGAGLYEIEAARLAAARAVSPRVRTFADQLVAQHTAVQEQLAALLRARGLEPPAQLPPQYAVRLSQLGSDADPAGFDRRFLHQVGLIEHLAQIAVHEHAADRTQDAALRAWFSQSLPMLRDHLRQAHALALGV